MKKIMITFAVLTLSINGFSAGVHSEDDGHDHSAHKEEIHVEIEKHDDHDGHDHSEHTKKEKDDHAGHDHGSSKAIGKGKAIVEVDPSKGFKLSKEAIKTLKLKLQTISDSVFEISKNSLVISKNQKGVYKFSAGFFKFLPAKVLKNKGDKVTVNVSGVEFGDQIVVNGVGLLRVSDIYSTDKSEYGHSH